MPDWAGLRSPSRTLQWSLCFLLGSVASSRPADPQVHPWQPRTHAAADWLPCRRFLSFCCLPTLPLLHLRMATGAAATNPRPGSCGQSSSTETITAAHQWQPSAATRRSLICYLLAEASPSLPWPPSSLPRCCLAGGCSCSLTLPAVRHRVPTELAGGRKKQPPTRLMVNSPLVSPSNQAEPSLRSMAPL